MPNPIEKWDYFELKLAAETSKNPFLDVTFEAEFVHGHRSITVTGFYDGDSTYRVRFMPDTEGDWQYVTHSNLDALDGQQGTFVCAPASASNHGPVRVIDPYHFAYTDGTPYHPVGTTCYVWNLQGDEMEEQTLATLKDAPFNKIRFCVFPKRYAFNSNEPPCYPFEGEVKRAWDPSMRDNYRAEPPPDFWDFTHFNPEYFQRLEKRILGLRELGIEADLIIFHPYDFGAWGFDRMPADVNDRYLKYLTARISAFRNLWWSFANEYDLMLNLDLKDWDHFFQVIEAEDPYDHLRSIHNCRPFYNHRKPWVTHCSVQHHDLLQVRTWLEDYGKPVVVDECGYEGDIGMAWGSLSAEAMVEAFWLGFTVGGYVGHGETYWNPEEVLWWAKGGELYGDSPARIVFLRQIIEAVPAPGFYPARDLETLNRYQSHYVGHPTRAVNGIEHNTGALGHGLSVSVGLALAAKKIGYRYRVFTLLGDGELAEGSSSEALMAAHHYKLDNLVVIIDRNTLQITGRTEDVMGLEPLTDKFTAFGCAVRTCNGNDIDALVETFSQVPFEPGKPSLAFAQTVKGKGISFIEDAVQWHHKVPTDDELKTAIHELESAEAALS